MIMYTPQQQEAYKAMRVQRKAEEIRIKNYLRAGRGRISDKRMEVILKNGYCPGGKVFQMIPGFNYRPVRSIQGMRPLV